MKQKKTRPSGSNRPGNVSSARNVRSVSNSREVSRRAKGKNRYAYEEDMRSSARYYDEDDYFRGDVRKKRSSAGGSNMKRRDDIRDSRNRNQSYQGDSKRKRRRGRRKNSVSKAIGIILAIIQFILSVILLVNILFFDMLPATYMLVLVGVLLILLGVTLLTQIGARGKGIGGKIFCIFMCAVLGAGSFYISKVNGALFKILGADQQTSSMVVAVRADDAAQKIADVQGYTFGVQYVSGAEQTRSVVKQVSKELGEEVQTSAYSGIVEEAQALIAGEVDAIVYNAGQTSLIKEQIPSFEEDTRIIYRHNIVIEIENEALDTSVTEPFAVYLSGTDQWTEVAETDRSDVNIIAVVNPKTHQVLLVTTPRDYYVPIPGVSGGQRDKLTHAGTYGVNASMETLEELYDVEIPFFGRINFTTMVKVVDALGGLDVESDMDFYTGDQSGHEFHVMEGMNHLNGKEALAFCRERKGIPDGDNARGRHQQAVITAIIKKMMSPAMLRGAVDIIESVSDGVDTNFSMEQIQALIKKQLRSNADWEILSVAAVGYDDRQPCYTSGSTPYSVVTPDEDAVAYITDLIDRMEAGEVLTEEDMKLPDNVMSQYY